MWQCYFLKTIKSVFILVQCNTSLSKNYVAHSITVVCVIPGRLNLRSLSALSGCLRIPCEISRGTRAFPQIRIQQQALKTFVEFRICWKRWKVWMLSNSNFVHCYQSVNQWITETQSTNLINIVYTVPAARILSLRFPVPAVSNKPNPEPDRNPIPNPNTKPNQKKNTLGSR